MLGLNLTAWYILTTSQLQNWINNLKVKWYVILYKVKEWKNALFSRCPLSWTDYVIWFTPGKVSGHYNRYSRPRTIRQILLSVMLLWCSQDGPGLLTYYHKADWVLKPLCHITNSIRQSWALSTSLRFLYLTWVQCCEMYPAVILWYKWKSPTHTWVNI